MRHMGTRRPVGRGAFGTARSPCGKEALPRRTARLVREQRVAREHHSGHHQTHKSHRVCARIRVENVGADDVTECQVARRGDDHVDDQCETDRKHRAQEDAPRRRSLELRHNRQDVLLAA